MPTPISKETAARSEHPTGAVIDPQTNDKATAYHPTMPSQVAEPTRTNSVPQQGKSGACSTPDMQSSRFCAASTMPGDGAEVHEKVPFKEQVIAAAKKTRGTVLGKVRARPRRLSNKCILIGLIDLRGSNVGPCCTLRVATPSRLGSIKGRSSC